MKLNYRTRKYIYGIAIAAMPLLIAYGALSEEQAPLWLSFIGAVLIPSMAWVNTTPPPEEGGHNE